MGKILDPFIIYCYWGMFLNWANSICCDSRLSILKTNYLVLFIHFMFFLQTLLIKIRKKIHRL